MAKDTIALPQPTKHTALKMLARKSETEPRILVYPNNGVPGTAWVVAGDRAFMGVMPVPAIMGMMQHQQSWELTKNEWEPTAEYDWNSTIPKQLAKFGEVVWDVPLIKTKALANHELYGLCRVLIDEEHYWCIQEIFVQCASLVNEPYWFRTTHHLMGRVLCAQVGWGEQSRPIAYIVAVTGFSPSVKLAERQLTNGMKPP